MSDEPKKRARAWIWWTLIAVLVLYPLSMGPVCWFAPDGSEATVEDVYAPIEWLRWKSESVDRVVVWYLGLLE
jgi:hypothetical protein